jgi:N-sulfoglucosamine sulfohydrolase
MLGAMTSALLLLALCVPAPQERNVVFVVSDDQGVVAGCYGDPDVETPALDALAADGVRFENAFCSAASCSPSRAALLSGLHGHANGMYGLQHGAHHFQSHARVRGLPVLLAEAGYRTARIGKYHVAPEDSYRFAEVLKGHARNPVQMAEACRPFVAADDERPFFLLFGTSDPHRGGGVAEERAGKPDRFGNRPGGYEGVAPRAAEPADLTLPAWLPDSTAGRAEWAQFLESVNRVDQGLARLVGVLREADVYDDTLFVFLSDHGPPFAGAKTTCYEPGLRTALVVRDPRAATRGRVVVEQASLVDLAPTVLAWCQVPAPAGLHGRSLLPLFAGDAPEDWTDRVYASHTFHEVTMYYPMRVVRTPRYKLIWNLAHGLPFPFASDLWSSATWQAARVAPGLRYGPRTIDALLHRPRLELYDLARDPLETTNLAADAEHAATLAELEADLLAFMERTQDPWRLKAERE